MKSVQLILDTAAGDMPAVDCDGEACVRALYRFFRAATICTQGHSPTTVQWQEFDIAGRACVGLIGAPLEEMGAPLEDMGGEMVSPEGIAGFAP